jgi:16S rRNA (guanine(527)-N(7))-methyltransferase RsmG
MADPWEGLTAAVRALDLRIDSRFEAQARSYLGELERWNRVARLTGYRTEAARVFRLVLDSLLFLAVLPEPATPLLDIGTGPGVPGLVLKLARPGWVVTLVEASRRRANFLRHVVRRLGLRDVDVREGRAETLAAEPDLRASFAAVTLRAVAAPSAAVRLARPFVRPGGTIVLARGPGAPPTGGRMQRVMLPREIVGLQNERAFLIIPASDPDREGQPDVPRETRGVHGPGPERREPEGRGREDHDRR